MIIAILIMGLLLWSQNVVVGYKMVYEYSDDGVTISEPKVKDFDSLEDAMEYAELRDTGWRGSVNEFYKWKYETE